MIKKFKKLLNDFQFWLASEPYHREEGIHDIARSPIACRKVEPPKKPSSFLVWVRYQQRFNKVRIQL